MPTTITTTTSIHTRRCALNSAPRPPPLRGGYLIFVISGESAARSGLVRYVNDPKTDANHSDRDAMKTTPIRCFFGEFYRGRG
nr:MAG TPA: Cell division activator [Caudoviricetes sp.]